MVSNVRVSEGNTKSTLGSVVSDASVCNYCVDVDSTTVDTCPNTPITPVGLPGGVVVKIPVVLAELTIRFNVSAYIDLPEPALEIKDIKKRLKITQCTLLQPTNILFIKGFVRKVIDYTTRTCSNRKGVCGEVHHCTVDVPFECSTPVTFTTPPAPLLTNSVSEFEYFKVDDLPNKYFAEKDNLLAGDLSEVNQFRTENFNELPFCDLITANLYEFDEFIGRHKPDCYKLPFEEKLFDRLEEKMVIELTLKLLQKRQVSIPPLAGGTSDRC
ncbi:hypothetical protein E9840_07150 [Tissierella creatinini]|nr:hypothetical protein E9840_07150 [Tissierella creatinini]TJX66066.1 hypothetical protein E8P77_09185 [Soehngenia saccharolytica]